MPTISPHRVAQVFVEVADTLVGHFDLVEFLRLVTTRTAELADVAAAGVLLADHHGHLHFIAASTHEERLVDLLQVQTDEGPCQDAFHTGAPTVNADLTTADVRWPQFAPRAVAAGYNSVHAIPLRLRDNVIGALNLFGADTGRLDPDDVKIVQALADVATIALLQERSSGRAETFHEQLQNELNTRVVIEQAKGVVAQLYNVDGTEAFELLRSYARGNSKRLVDVANAVTTAPATFPELDAD